MSKAKKENKWSFIMKMQQTIADAEGAIRRLQREIDPVKRENEELRAANIKLAADNQELMEALEREQG